MRSADEIWREIQLNHNHYNDITRAIDRTIAEAKAEAMREAAELVGEARVEGDIDLRMLQNRAKTRAAEYEAAARGES